ncbi:unnamed protein product [Leptosia nina]|uniref:WD repeat-containing protein 55 homolog n=1 Tax=Leptosia nina TaxID=320188 RepID=A0AAV1K3H4_9NEOP
METKVHKFRFYNPKPISIQCVSYEKRLKLLAVARKDASIEIWDVNYSPYLIQVIPGAENASVEALAWVNNRLLSTGLGGALVEWDLEYLSIKNSVMLTGFAAWCLDVDNTKTLAAVGTEQGYVNLYSVSDGNIEYKRLFDKQEGRILCCKFNKTGNILVTGSIDTIRLWNANTGHATCRISCNRRGREVIVWDIGILSDNTIVSGDSLGRLTFWDGNTGDQVESFLSHKADILSLVISEDETYLYCSGIDPVINMFKKIVNADNPSETRWVKNIQRNIHEHDVRALVINDRRLISLGADGYVTLSSYPPKEVMRIPPMIPMPRTSVSAAKKLLLLRYNNHLEIWKLGSYATDDNGQVIINAGIKQRPNKHNNKEIEKDTELPIISKSKFEEREKSLEITEEPIKMASILAKSKKQILCCDISPSGEFIVYSTDTHVRMLKMDEDQGNVSLQKLNVNELKSCNRVLFSEDSQMMVASRASDLFVLHVDVDVGATLQQKIPTRKYLKEGSILHIILSTQTPNGIYLAAANTTGEIAVWLKKTKKFEYLLNLPKYHCVPCAMVIHDMILFISYVDQEFMQYDLAEQKLMGSGSKSIPCWGQRKMAAHSIVPHPTREALLFTDETALWVLDKHKIPEYYEPEVKRRPDIESSSRVNIMPVKYLAGFHWLTNSEAVLIEILPEKIVMQLPPIMHKKKHNMVISK